MEDCQGYKRLREKANSNIKHGWGEDRINPGFDWTIARAEHYAEKLNMPINDILNSWVDQCNISFLNHFQDCNYPEIKSDKVRVFETVDKMIEALGGKQFRCPSCNGISNNPYKCDSGQEMSKGKICDWKVYGLFGDLGKGVFVYCKDKLKGENIFMPIAWEV